MNKITLPLDLVSIDHNSYHIFIPCTINHIECEMLVDTGASRTVFDISHLSQTIPEIHTEEIITAAIGSGDLNAQAGILNSFSIGNLSWNHVQVMFMDLSHINLVYERICQKKIAGLFGGDFLHRTKACLDYGKARIHFSVPAKFKPIL